MRIDPAEYHRENRCPDCRLMRRLCICAELPEVEAPLEVVVIQHDAERESLSNTGTLAARVLRRARVAAWPGELPDLAPGLLLYPQPGAEPLAPAHLEGAERLVVLDATWRRARRMYRKIGALRGLVPVHVDGVHARWALRRSPGPGRLNTAEAIAAALAALGATGAAGALHAVLDRFMPRAQHMVRRIPFGEVPE